MEGTQKILKRNQCISSSETLVVSPGWRPGRGGSPATAGVVMGWRVPLIPPVIVPVPLVVIPGWPVVPVRLPVPVLSVPVLPPVPVLVVPVPLPVVVPVPVMIVMVARLFPVSRRTIIVTIILVIAIITSIIVATGWRGSPVIISIISIIASTPPSVITAASILSSTTTSGISTTSSEARSCGFAVVEVNPGCWAVGGGGDGEVNPDSEPCYLSPIQLLSGLLRITHAVKVNEGKSSGSFRWTIKNHIDLLNLPKLAKFPLQILLSCREVQSKHAQAVGWLWVLPVSAYLRGPGERARPASGRS